jgi:hypothetical protein
MRCIEESSLAFTSGSACNQQNQNLRTLALLICRQEHFREFAEGIVPQVNDAIALARGLKMPIYYSQHGQHASCALCATRWAQLVRKP